MKFEKRVAVAEPSGKHEDRKESTGFCIWILLLILKRAVWEKHVTEADFSGLKTRDRSDF